MNPFDLPGPQFLLFYLLLSLFILAVVWLLRRNAEAGPPPQLNLADPYLVAYLRAGEAETMRLAVVSLIERDMLATNGTQLLRKSKPGPKVNANPLEHAVLSKFSQPGEAASIYKDASLKAVCQQYRQQLEQVGLLPDNSTKAARWLRMSVAVLFLGGVGAVKVMIGLSRERPVAFLVILMILVLIALIATSFPRLTERGKEFLEDARTLYGGLRDQAAVMQSGAATPEVLMLAAVFGVGVLSTSAFGYTRQLFPQATSSSSSSSSSCGSSCSSSDSGGSSCGSSCGGGGGCGGCGGS